MNQDQTIQDQRRDAYNKEGRNHPTPPPPPPPPLPLMCMALNTALVIRHESRFHVDIVKIDGVNLAVPVRVPVGIVEVAVHGFPAGRRRRRRRRH